MLCQFILWVFSRIEGGVEAHARSARGKLLCEQATEAETAATSELLREGIRQHVAINIAGRAAFFAEHGGHGRGEQLADENRFELCGNFLGLLGWRRIPERFAREGFPVGTGYT